MKRWILIWKKKQNLSLVISGPRGSGKTECVKYLVKNAFLENDCHVYYKALKAGDIIEQ